MRLLIKFYSYLWNEAYRNNDNNILSLLEENPNALVLDVGCGDGKKTSAFKIKINCQDIYGIDGVSARLDAAKKRGVKVTVTNLEKKWPFSDNKFDVVISNQVIEHIVDIDHFICEIYRILKPGGYCVVSTENLSSWHNIFALILGFQDFSHHILKKSHVSNPLSPHYGEKTVTWSREDNSGVDDTAFPHIKIFTLKSLINSFKLYQFEFSKALGSGYYPLLGLISKLLSSFDPYHSHFITIKMYAKKS